MLNKIKRGVLVLIAVLPWSVRKHLLRRFYGWEIGVGAWVGFSVVLCERVSLRSGARIASGNIIINLDALELGENGRIGRFNWISGVRSNSVVFRESKDRASVCLIGRESAVTTRHFIDCSHGFTIGEFSTLAGLRTTVLSHSVDLDANCQSGQPVRIGDYCFIGSNCTILAGTTVESRVAIGAGALLPGKVYQSGGIYGGSPAKRLKDVPEAAQYFKRKSGFVR